MLLILFILPLLILIPATTWLAIVLLMARSRVRPPRLTPLKALFALGRANPGDLGFAFEPVKFDTTYMSKPLRLSASLVRHPSANGHLVILLHGFADSSAGACAWLPMLQQCAVNVLLVDLPGHGDSPDALCTAGFHERHAIAQIIDQMRAAHPDASRVITLFGISMGSAIALAAACLPEARVSGVVADSPFADIRRACILHARLFGFPGAIFQRPATRLLEHRLNLDYGLVAPIDTIDKTPCPVLLIQAGRDALISPEDAAIMRAKLDARNDGISRTLVIDNAPHILGLATDPAAYYEAVSAFLRATRPQ